MNPIKNLLSWYFSKNALPYWCLLLIDCTIVFASGAFSGRLFTKAELMYEYREEVIYTLLLYVMLSLVGARLFHTYSGILR